ncbi:A24 family peptidase [Gudongella sp. DL1XJH-153]|uniref:A24 family peptidase n=1 Tax=Gudongella sp. DL1XJH-153 TaxID=3409804 RepID=UPI003BB68693
MNLILNDIILFSMVILAVYFDLTQKKIPNFITLPVILWGLSAYTIFGGFEGFKFSFFGFITGLGILVIPFILGALGGGDVKFLAAIGALKGFEFTLYTLLYSSFAGGVIVIIYLIYKKKLGITLKRILGLILRPLLFVLTSTFNNQKLKEINDYFLGLGTGVKSTYLPYGVAIGLGVVISYVNGVIK